MRKIFYLIPLFLLLIGCSSDEDEVKYCWNFQIMVKTTIYDGDEKTSSSSVFTDKTICDLTEKEANKVKTDIYNIETGNKDGYDVQIVTEVINMTKIDGYEMSLEKEKKSISNFISANKISVISQSDFISMGCVTDINKNQYVHLASGVYMQIIDKGTSGEDNGIKSGSKVSVAFSEYDIMSQKEILLNEKSVFIYNETSYSKSGTFVSGKMLDMYGSSVPAAWIAVLDYIYDGAHVKLIVPSKMGHKNAVIGVTPYLYELKLSILK